MLLKGNVFFVRSLVLGILELGVVFDFVYLSKRIEVIWLLMLDALLLVGLLLDYGVERVVQLHLVQSLIHLLHLLYRFLQLPLQFQLIWQVKFLIVPERTFSSFS